MSTQARTPRPKDRHGLKTFKKAIGALRRSGHAVPANRFQEALTHRKRLMQQLRKLDPENPLLAELDALDKLPG